MKFISNTVLCHLLLIASISAQGFQNPQLINNAANGATSVYAADLDGDGDMDVLSACSADNEIAWHENQGLNSGSFGPKQVLAGPSLINGTAVAASCVYATDIDGDGDIDVLSASENDGKIAWYENQGLNSGTFGAQNIIAGNAGGPECVFATDLDGDGDTDVLATSANFDRVVWYENLGPTGPGGSSTFGNQQVLTYGTDNASSVYATDMDGDGDMDVLSASYNDDKIAWYENRLNEPSADFGPQQPITTNADGARSVYATDLDSDGDMDVLSASYNDDKIAWYENRLNEATADFGPQQPITTNANGARSVYATDLDGDGDKDVLSASFWDDKIAWYENVGAGNGSFGGTFGNPKIVANNANGADSVYATDLDGDGDADVLSASYTADEITWYENGFVPTTPPTVNYTGNPTTGDVPLVVNFTDQSTNYPTSWLWDFGDGNTSTDPNPTHTYTMSGTYTVVLTATNASGPAALTKPDYITANPTSTPSVSFTGTPTTGGVPLTVTFTDTSTNSPTSWLWDFGDGNTSTEQNPTHTYTSIGNYTPVLVTTNALGSGFGYSSNYITVNQPAPVVSFTGTPTTGTSPLAVSFTDQSTNSPTSWAWDFGDGNTSTDQNPTHTYTTHGTYNVTLTATNVTGSGSESLPNYITVNQPVPVVSFAGTPTTGTYPLTVGFTDTSTNSPTSWLWDFGDGNTSSVQNPSHMYTAPGQYTVVLTATNASASSSLSSPDYIDVFYFGNEQLIPTAGSVATPYKWLARDLDGDGDNDLLCLSLYRVAWCEHLGLQSGSFGPEQIISSGSSYLSDICTSDVDNDGDLDVLITSGTDDRVAWYENLGIGNGVNGGLFSAQIVITNNVPQASCLYTADFNGDGYEDIVAGSSLHLTDRIFKITNLGAGNGGGTQFAGLGEVTVLVDAPACLNAADLDGDGDMDLLSVSISDNKIAWYENTGLNSASFGAQQILTQNGSGPRRVTAADLDGDGDQDVIYQYAFSDRISWSENLGNGTFSGQLYISSNANGCRDVRAVDFDGDGDLDLLASEIRVITGQGLNGRIVWYENLGNVTFTKQVISELVGYGWIFHADLDGDGDQDIISSQPPISGNPLPTLLVWHENAYSSSFQPLAGFSANPTTGTAPLTVTFTDQSTHFPTSWLWDFGDGQASTDQNPTHTYTTLGSYTVTLTTTNSTGSTTTSSVDLIRVLNYAGSGMDLQLAIGINTSPMPYPEIHSAVPGDQINILFSSPDYSYSMFPPLLAAQLFPTGSPPTGPIPFPEVHIGTTALAPYPAVVLYDGSLLGLTPSLPPTGYSLAASIPAGMTPISIMLQGFSLGPNPNNPFFTTTDAHEIQIQ